MLPKQQDHLKATDVSSERKTSTRSFAKIRF